MNSRRPKRVSNFFTILVLVILVGLVCSGGIWSTVSGQTVPVPNATPAALPDLGSLTVVKLAEPLVQPGQKVRFTLVISNLTHESITGLTVTDSVPDTIKITEISSQKGNITRTGNHFSFLIPVLEAGERSNLFIDTELLQSSSTISIPNTATFSYTQSGKSFTGESSPSSLNLTFPTTTAVSPAAEGFSAIATGFLILAGLSLILAVVLAVMRRKKSS
jgi:uncharacterized repeat protein (TIGR01451 family)